MVNTLGYVLIIVNMIIAALIFTIGNDLRKKKKMLTIAIITSVSSGIYGCWWGFNLTECGSILCILPGMGLTGIAIYIFKMCEKHYDSILRDRIIKKQKQFRKND